ncbi:thrombospondin type 3 repeat-containing protein [Massilia sp. H6]|uniref:thrombospondin type 3 repeat-containing protein n=1 Tax=Massilia sp. H6 TaxID=2970464 RepID=UPI0021682D1C|nr:thrombospondin type 3 repeat-containing protein [Massilia sp. H6]UVW26895.1 thrombospondin type 3 repeat-containing protein [Massilia sp. H6]
MTRTLTVAALIATGAAFAPLPALAQTDFQLYIGSAPPAPVYERIPVARRGQVWAPGYWAWRGHRHHWVPGHYIVARPGYVYAAPSWHQRHGRWYMEPAHWRQHGRDRNRNGVPDRYERRDYQPVYAAGYGYNDGRGGYRDGYRDGRGYGHGYRDERDRDRDGIPDHYERGGRRDFDRDGVPNRYDRDLDNDGVRNRRDRDRDGDGVRNRHDNYPNNPYRR